MDRETKEMFNLIIKKLNNLESGLNAQLKEHSEYLQALLHSAEVSKAERDKVSLDIAKNQGELERIKNDFKIHRHKIALDSNIYDKIKKLS